MTLRENIREALSFCISLLLLGTVLVGSGKAAATNNEGSASINAGGNRANPNKPFVATQVAEFDQPWATAFLPDGRLLVTERLGRLFLVTQQGNKREVSGIPEVSTSIHNGLLDIAVSPNFGEDGQIYFTYSNPRARGLALARARLDETGPTVRLVDQQIIWQQPPRTRGLSLWGGVIAFDPAGRHLFLTVRDSSRLSSDPSGAQDPDSDLGKVLRLNLDGTTPADNPMAGSGGTRAQVWTLGHRTAYGLAFAPDGKLWLHEMGPEGGDEFNLLQPGSNYGWPRVSNGNNYGGDPIPRHATRPEFKAPALYWTPVIAPGGLAFYNGDLFPAWRGSALITGLFGNALVQVSVNAADRAREVGRWDMGARIRDVAVARDGAVWLIEDASPGRLLRLTPK